MCEYLLQPCIARNNEQISVIIWPKDDLRHTSRPAERFLRLCLILGLWRESLLVHVHHLLGLHHHRMLDLQVCVKLAVLTLSAARPISEVAGLVAGLIGTELLYARM